MTDTPRTDRLIDESGTDGLGFSELARQLERELTEARRYCAIADQALAILSAGNGSAYADKLADWAQIRMGELAAANARIDSLTLELAALEHARISGNAELIAQRDAANARALRAEAVEREVCEGRCVYLQHEMDEVAQRALKAEEARDAAERELSVLRLCYSRAVDPGEHEAVVAQNAEHHDRAIRAEAHAATLIEALQYVRPYCKAKYGMPDDIEERLDAAIYQRSI
jgi:hypothetical protein